MIKSNHYEYVVVITSFIIMAMIWSAVHTFGVLFDSLIINFNWDRAMISGASSLRDIIFGISCIGTAKLSEMYGPRIPVSISSLFLGLGYILMSRINVIWHLYFFHGVLVAVGMSSYIAILSTVSRWFDRTRSTVTGFVLSGMGFSNMMAPIVANRLIRRLEWRTSFIIIGVIVFLVVIICAQFLKDAPMKKSLDSPDLKICKIHNQSTDIPLYIAIRTRQLKIICLLYFIFLYCLQAIMAHFVIFTIDIGFSTVRAVSFLTTAGGFAIVGMNIMGLAAEKHGNKMMLTIGFFLMALSLFCLITIKSLLVLYFVAVIFGLAYGGIQILLSPIVADLFGLKLHSIILSIAAFTGNIGGAAGPFLSGYIFDSTSSYNVAFLICVLMAVLGFICSMMLGPIKIE